MRRPIQSEKYGDGKSQMSTGFVSFTLRIITMNKSLNILFIYIKKAKSVDFPGTGEVML